MKILTKALFALSLMCFLLVCNLTWAQLDSNGVCIKIMEEPTSHFDFHRDWGVQLLPRNDSAFKDPEYLAGIQVLAAPAITNFGGSAQDLLWRYQGKFEDLARGRIVDFAHSGTVANNLLLRYADSALSARKNAENHTKASIIFLDDPYIGLRGEMLDERRRPEDCIRDVPTIHPNEKLTPTELGALKKKERDVLDKVKEMIDSPDSRVGGIFLEPISINHAPLRIYRAEFLRELQKVAHERNVLIFADEVMSGGGRTGKFWGYEHYEGFTPDILTFGKGLILSGVFVPKGSKLGPSFARPQFGSYTTAGNPMALLQSLQVLKALENRNLVENARVRGAELRERLIREAQFDPGSVRCLGLMCSVMGPSGLARGYGSRWLPPLTLTSEEIDVLIENFKRELSRKR